jgi:hypothetical protein
LLGGWLAQRQAALRGVMAAGARLTFFFFRACRRALEHFVCQKKNVRSGGEAVWDQGIGGPDHTSRR